MPELNWVPVRIVGLRGRGDLGRRRLRRCLLQNERKRSVPPSEQSNYGKLGEYALVLGLRQLLCAWPRPLADAVLRSVSWALIPLRGFP